MSPSDGPTAQDLSYLLDRLRPRIARLFQVHRLTEPEAERLVCETLVGVAYRWGRIRDRERWLLAALERAIRSGVGRCSKEREDE